MNNKTALLLIDWQQGLRIEARPTEDRSTPEAAEKGARLATHWRGKGWPVITVQHNSTEENSDLRPGLPGHALEPFAEPQGNEPHFTKTVNSAFLGTDLQLYLMQNGIHDLVVSGLTTDHCVSTTVRMAENLGFNVTLVSDACAAFGKTLPDGSILTGDDIHRANLASLQDEFAAIATTDAVLSAG